MSQHDDGVVRLEIAPAIRQAHAEGDHRKVASLLARAPMQAWFGLHPNELRLILAAVPPTLVRLSIPLSILDAMLRPPGIQDASAVTGRALHALRRGVSHFRLRARGAPNSALGRTSGLEKAIRTASALFDTTGGLEGIMAVQAGITKMLAGEFHGALANFTRAQLNPAFGMPFITRDSHVKAALIHAQFGDPELARTHLDAAATYPRSDSWTEPVIDSHAEIAEILLLPAGEAAAARGRINALPLSEVGELWPYYVQAAHTVHARAGRRREGTRRVEILRTAAPLRERGEGLPGSVFETTLAEDAALRGETAVARALLDRADPELVTTRLVAALVDHVAGDFHRAVQRLVTLEKITVGLRRLDIRRLLLLATALHGLGDVAACVSTIRETRERYGKLHATERQYLPTALWPVVREHISDWPAPVAGAPQIELPPVDALLTPRERDVLAGLLQGLSREEIAVTLFVSVNTVKTHQRSLYRKLGATNRTEALLEAGRRGLV